MKFKIVKGTELFNKLTAINKRCVEANEAADVLAKKFGGTHACSKHYEYRCGGIDAIYFGYDNEPDKEFWMKPDRHNNPRLFYPRYSKKTNIQNQSIHDAIKALPAVTMDEFNEAIGFKYHWVGFTNYRTYNLYVFDDYVLIEIGEGANYTPLPDMVEILESEYNKLNKLIPEPKEK